MGTGMRLHIYVDVCPFSSRGFSDMHRASGECWCGSTSWQGRHAMRISVSSWATMQGELERTVAAIQAAQVSHS